MLAPSNAIASGPPTTRKLFVRVPAGASSPGACCAHESELPDERVAATNKIRAMDSLIPQSFFLISILLESGRFSRSGVSVAYGSLSRLRLLPFRSVHPENRADDPFG